MKTQKRGPIPTYIRGRPLFVCILLKNVQAHEITGLFEETGFTTTNPSRADIFTNTG